MSTPFFEQFAKRSIVFDHALTCVPITLPAHTSLLTGLYPPSHGVRNNGTFRASDSLQLISEYAQQQGYETAAIIGGFPLVAQFGLNQGFRTYDDHFPRTPSQPGTYMYTERSAEQVRQSAQAWLDHHKDKFFLWMHFFDPHHPYLEHGIANATPYQQEVSYVDQQLQLLFQYLQQNKLDQNALIVITADHGEAFGEHGEISHSLFVYNTTLRIPMLISAPGISAGRNRELVRIVDIAPTILDFMHWKMQTKMDGISLLPLLQRGEWKLQDSYAESFAPAIDFGWSPLRTIQDEKSKYIEAPRPEFYDLTKDPDETKNEMPVDLAQPYAKRLQTLGKTAVTPEPHPLSPEERERLESLGYFSSPPTKLPANAPDPKDRVDAAREIAELSMSPSSLNDKAKAYAQIVQNEPSNPLLLLRYAEILLKLEKYKQAEQTFQQVLNLEYPSAAAYNGLATVYFSRNDLTHAQQILKQAESLHLADGETYYNLGEFAFQSGNPAQAFDYYNHSMTLEFLPAFYRAARIKEAGGDLNTAMDFLHKAEELAPSDAQVHSERAMLYFRHGKFDDAIAEFQKALQMNPDNPSAYYNIGLAYVRLGKKENARQYLQKFLTVAPKDWQQERATAKGLLSRS